MVGLSSLLDIARSALTTSQQSMAVTGHNVANVNTPGYSRQEAVLAERIPLSGQPGMVGTGVQATTIRRQVDQFINQQLTDSRQDLGRLNVTRDELFRLQDALGMSGDQGIGARLDDLFRGLQDVATSPGELTTRSVLLANAAQLASAFNGASTTLAATRQSLDLQVLQTVTDINSLTSQIAELNGKIVSAEDSGQNANDLRDQRDLALNELAQRIDVTTLETATGGLSVFTSRGQILVESISSHRLAAVPSTQNDNLLDVGYDFGGSRVVSIGQQITNGSLRSLLDLRDTTIPDLQAQFDRLAATLSNAVNEIHRQGFGLDGSTGQDFFSPLSVTAKPDIDNQGTGTIGSGAITASSLQTFHDYEIRFSSATAYSIVDATSGSTIRGNYTGTVITAPTSNSPVNIVTGTNDTLAVTVDGVSSGTITLAGAASPGQAYSSGTALAQEIETKINADATLQAAGRTVSVSYDTTTSRFIITSNATTSASAVNVTGGTARTALGLSSGTSTGATGTFTDPTTFIFDGISVTVSDTPAANDVFHVNAYAGTSSNLAVAITDPAAVAASSTQTGVPGNNDILLQLVGIQNGSFSSLGNRTLQETYRNVAANVGVFAQTADRDLSAQEILRDQIETFRSQVSGVSIDEELVNMIKFQRGFEAASKLIKITDEMMATLLSLK